MANTQRGQAKLHLDKERTLLFDLNALADVEDRLGVSMTEIGNNISIKIMRTLLHAGLVHEDPELTERQVGSMITMDNIAEVQEALSVAMGGGKN
ncbi:hypothetical protein [Bacillus cereus]|jgi:hypothetical protein|uniref:hypothetical protein n=1 Tax=Bacillus cereus group TaxID=86661 RepID=UPI00355729D7